MKQNLTKHVYFFKALFPSKGKGIDDDDESIEDEGKLSIESM